MYEKKIRNLRLDPELDAESVVAAHRARLSVNAFIAKTLAAATGGPGVVKLKVDPDVIEHQHLYRRTGKIGSPALCACGAMKA